MEISIRKPLRGRYMEKTPAFKHCFVLTMHSFFTRGVGKAQIYIFSNINCVHLQESICILIEPLWKPWVSNWLWKKLFLSVLLREFCSDSPRWPGHNFYGNFSGVKPIEVGEVDEFLGHPLLGSSNFPSMLMWVKLHYGTSCFVSWEKYRYD